MVKTVSIADYQRTATTDMVMEIYNLNIQTIDETDALGLVLDKVRRACEEAGLPASEDDIRAAADGIWAQLGRPGATPTRDWRRDVSDSVEAASNNASASDAEYSRAELPGMPEPKSVLRAPQQAEFGEDDAFIVSSALARRAKILTDRHPEHLDHLDGMAVVYLWKKSGGKSKGRLVFGKCTKPSGLLKLFSESTFVIWLAADHCIAAGYGDREIEALLFHEMLHTDVAEADEETGRGGGPTLVPHELEVFRAEVEIYGLWAPDLKGIGPAFQQLTFSAAMAATPSHDIDPRDLGDAVDDLDDAGAGVLIHDDGTPLTAEEIAEQEAAEANGEYDDPANPDAEYDDTDDLTDL